MNSLDHAGNIRHSPDVGGNSLGVMDVTFLTPARLCCLECQQLQEIAPEFPESPVVYCPCCGATLIERLS
ncbi:MAG: hypothetical protein HY319_28635 [Armatimonadetes bacterium]|nr:hypothetical protein [Armatimonadota bacterium]